MSISYIINNQEGLLTTGQTINGNIKINGDLSGTTFYGDGSNLTGISGGGSSQFTGGTVTGETTFTSGVTFDGITIFTSGVTFDGITGNTVSATTINADMFYGDGSNLSGVVGLTYSELGFTITSLTPGINQDVILPYNATVTYPTPLIINGGYSVTVPVGTTLTIV